MMIIFWCRAFLHVCSVFVCVLCHQKCYSMCARMPSHTSAQPAGCFPQRPCLSYFPRKNPSRSYTIPSAGMLLLFSFFILVFSHCLIWRPSPTVYLNTSDTLRYELNVFCGRKSKHSYRKSAFVIEMNGSVINPFQPLGKIMLNEGKKTVCDIVLFIKLFLEELLTNSIWQTAAELSDLQVIGRKKDLTCMSNHS